MGTKADLRRACLVKRLPSIFGRGAAIPQELEGATIVAVGTLRDRSAVEGGGLVIDYRPLDIVETHRLVLAFDETAMWVESLFLER